LVYTQVQIALRRNASALRMDADMAWASFALGTFFIQQVPMSAGARSERGLMKTGGSQ